MKKTAAVLLKLLKDDRFIAVCGAIQWFTMLCWLMIMVYSSSYYVVYLIIGITGFCCRSAVRTGGVTLSPRERRGNLIISAIFSLGVILANYDISDNALKAVIGRLTTPSSIAHLVDHFSLLSVLFFLLFFPFLFLGGVYVTYFILACVQGRLTDFEWKRQLGRYSPRRVFLLTFCLFTVVYSSVMLFCFYPGILSVDSRNQIRQIITGQYNNRNPIAHTLLIKLFVEPGIQWFHNINIGIVCYSLFSIMLVAGVFAYVIVTLYQLRINRRVIFAVMLFQLTMPEHIIYSFTMWKDIPFSMSILLFCVSSYRFMNGICRNRRICQLLLLLSSFGICLFRVNGLIVFLLIVAVFARLYYKERRRMLVSLACVLLVSFTVTYPVLSALHLEQADSVEMISMPLQQVARTLRDHHDDLTSDEKKLISQVADIALIRENYNPGVSDPIKDVVREQGNPEYLNRHFGEFVLLYGKLGLRHPLTYLEAWVDQTKGYWNSGYDYWRIMFAADGKELGVRRIVVSETAQKAFLTYYRLYDYLDILKPLHSIGLFTWLLLLVLFISCKRKNKLIAFLTVPCLAVILSLLIGTPVFAEFRYAYPLFCCLPFLTVAALTEAPKKASEQIAE